MAILFNINRDPEKIPEGIQWLDVFPEWKEPEKQMSDDEMLDSMKAWVMATEGLSDQHS